MESGMIFFVIREGSFLGVLSSLDIQYACLYEARKNEIRNKGRGQMKKFTNIQRRL